MTFTRSTMSLWGLSAEDLWHPCPICMRFMQILEAFNRLAPRLAFAIDPSAATMAKKAVAAACGSGGKKKDEAEGDGAASAAAPEGRVPREEFVNQKLGSKLAQQLKDVLSICGGNMPQWISDLVGPCKFLFPFEIRRR